MATNEEKKELLRATIDALGQLMSMFRAERYVYLLLAIVSFCLTIYVAYEMTLSAVPSKETLLAVFGSSGILTVASVRVTWFFSKAFNIFEELIRRFSR
jgi:hypothetical protein